MNVLIVDDHPVFLEGLKNLMKSHDFNVIGTASNGEEAIPLAKKLNPDIIMMDIHMPEIDGIEATKRIKSILPDTKIIILTSFEEEEKIFKAIKAGASGYLLKNINSNILIQKIRDLKTGDNPFSPAAMDKILDTIRTTESDSSNNVHLLSEKQIQIIKLIGKGLTYAEIGEKLYISERTVKYHISQIKGKIGAKNKAEILHYGVVNDITL